MKRVLFVALAATALSSPPAAAAPLASAGTAVPLTLPAMPLHDPYIVADRASRTYYLYTSNVPAMSGECGVGIMAYTSRDLTSWTTPAVVFRMPKGGWADAGAWAPEVHAWRGKYYLFTTLHNEAATLGTPTASGWPAHRRGTVLAVADGLLGPFVPVNGGEPLAPKSMMTLDGTLHVDRDGKPWYVFAHEWVQVGDGTIEAMPLTQDLAPAGAPVVLFKASSASWAKGDRPVGKDGARAANNVYVTDGPELIPSRDGSLLMLWSSYDRDGYVQSVARSASGKITGPWEQLDPIVRRDSGHGMVFDTFDGKRMLVLHRPFENARGKLYEVRDAGGRLEVLNERVDLDGDHLMAPKTPAPADRCGKAAGG